jgi:prefoldin subunit 5
VFKNKYLKQLQGVQAQIKNCKASIAKLNPPKPDSHKIENEILCLLEKLMYGCHTDLAQLFEVRFSRLKGETCDYLRELGEYFINIADYDQEMKRYETELAQLQKEERRLKEKLGIE